MNAKSSLSRHARNLSISSVLSMVAGLVSFPILTRALSVTDYGLMSLIATVLTLAVAVGKLGLQHSALRFFSESEKAAATAGPLRFRSTLFFGMLAGGVAMTVMWGIASILLPAAWVGGTQMRTVLLMVAPLVVVRVIDSAVVNQLRAEERSGWIATYQLVARYLSLAMVVAALLLGNADLLHLYGATFVSELLPLVTLAFLVYRVRSIRIDSVDRALYRAMVGFGVPMLFYEISSICLSMGDRYLINAYLGADKLGVYTAAYNLSSSVRVALLTSLTAMAMPMYVRAWEQGGRGAAESILSDLARSYLPIAAGLAAILATVASSLLAVLATSRYLAGAPVIPVIFLAQAFESYFVVCAAGLYIAKRSRTVMLTLAIGAASNMGLNVLLIPQLGIMGSALSSLLTCMAVAGFFLWTGRETVAPPVPVALIGKVALSGIAAYFTASPFEFSSAWESLVVRGTIASIVYGVFICLLDRQVRGTIRSTLVGMAEKFGWS